jgi:succinoglycan biosynthesis transport protein ExoP
MEDEVSLRKYIDVLIKHWKLIVSIIVIAVIVAGLFSFLVTPTYEAKAGVVITNFKAVTTHIQEETLITLVESSNVASPVIEQLGDELEPEEQSVANIISMVSTRSQGNFIEISVESSDPEKAAAIANAWAESYASYINSFYGSILSSLLQSPEELRAQADAAKEEYEEREELWEDFVRNNRIDELNQQISDTELLCQVKSLRQQLETGSSSSASTLATGLAFILLQAEAFTSLPFGIQIPLDEVSGINVSLDDVDVLISTLETRSGSTPGQSLSELQQAILELRVELAEESAEELALSRSKDIAWNIYATLDSEAVELQVAVQTPEAAVRVATVAFVPESPVAPRRVMNIVIALVLGLIAGVFAAFVVEYLGKPQEKPRKKKGRS